MVSVTGDSLYDEMNRDVSDDIFSSFYFLYYDIKIQIYRSAPYITRRHTIIHKYKLLQTISNNETCGQTMTRLIMSWISTLTSILQSLLPLLPLILTQQKHTNNTIESTPWPGICTIKSYDAMTWFKFDYHITCSNLHAKQLPIQTTLVILHV